MKNTESNITFLEKVKVKIGAFAEKNIFLKSTKKQNQQSISIFQNLKQINIALWYDILEENNVKLLDKNYTEDKKYSELEIIQLNDTFLRLYDLFFEKLNNEYSKSSLQESQDKINIISKIALLEEAVKTLLFIKQNYNLIDKPIEKEKKIYDTVKILSKYVNFKDFNTIDENIEIINKIILSLESGYTRKYGNDNEEQNKNKYSLEEQLFDIGQIITSGIPNAKETSVEMFIVYINKANEISNLRKKQQNARS